MYCDTLVSSLDSIGLSLPPADMYEHDRKLPVATTKDTTKFVEVCNGDQVEYIWN